MKIFPAGLKHFLPRLSFDQNSTGSEAMDFVDADWVLVESPRRNRVESQAALGDTRLTRPPAWTAKGQEAEARVSGSD